MAITACYRIEEENSPATETKELTITATREAPDTKTERQSNGDVYWNPSDAISLFFRSGTNGGSKFTAQNTEAVPIAQFKGTIDVISGGGEDTGGEFWFWGIYPYSTENSCDGNAITTIIPTEQVGKAGTFADNTFITMARAKGLELGFYNICSGIKFSLTRDDIKEVRFCGNNEENIAGKIKAVSDNAGKPAIQEYVSGSKAVKVTAPNSGTFETGKDYYLVFAPELLTKGFTMTLITNDDKQGVFLYTNERQFKRGIFVNISNLNERVNVWADAAAAAVKPVTDEGGTVDLEIESDTECHAVIPDEAKSWISVLPETKTLTNKAIRLKVEPNTGWKRSATIEVKDDATSVVLLTYTINQDYGGIWKEGTVPPDNEIWYITNDGTIIDLYASVSLYNSQLFDVNVISHTYENGRGVIKCDGPIRVILDHAFGNGKFKNITSLFLPDSIEELKCGALRGIGVTELRIPDNLQCVDSYALNSESFMRFTGKHTSEDGRCVIIEDGYMPSFGNTYVPTKNYLAAFAPSGIREYSIPSNAEILGPYAFAWCPELRVIHFNEGLKYLLGDCFMGDYLDCDIVIPANTIVQQSPFNECRGIKGFYGNPTYCSKDHYCLIADDGCIINFVGYDVVDYSIPDGVTGIRGEGFNGMTKLQTITFPSSVQYISRRAFMDCPSLKSIHGDCVSDDNKGIIYEKQFYALIAANGIKSYSVQEGLESIGYEAFVECPDLEEVIIPDSVTELGGYDFAYCYKLKKVVLSANLKSANSYNPFLATPNLEEIYFRSFVPPTYSDTQFYESDCSHLTVYVPEETLMLYKNAPQWSQYAPYMVGYHYDDIGEWDPGYYVSTDFSHDGEVTTLQQATSGNGIDLVLMGDAFSDRQIADGTYDTVMRNAMSAFFSEEPYKSFKERFNVSYVKVVSMTEGYEHPGQALGTGFGTGTYVYGNDDKVIEYAQRVVPDSRMDDALIIVMMNRDYYAGTCFMYYPTVSGDYGRGLSIAYFPTSSNTDTFNGLVSHEAGGHGFAKLADEYAYEEKGAVPSDVVSTARGQEAWGWSKNVDFTGDPTQVKWAQFISDTRYASENIGCYEGAYTYWTGAWRPTENSIMRYNTGGFNAPSRYAIWYRINKLAFGANWNGTYEDFVTYDAVNRTPAASARRQAQIRKRQQHPLPPLAPPVVVGHSWREEVRKVK